ncbi:MAG: ThuA domain-containing protein [Verrucomicrobia bacterium]|nr:ThuA domain-containing protein [Verrucomicrobiota bacterium]
MKPLGLFASLLVAALATKAGEQVLIVADEFPAMRVLADSLEQEEGWRSRIVSQGELPAVLADFRAVVVYIRRALEARTEKALIEYAEGGGKLVALHHSISSGKRTNQWWFAFLGVDLKPGDAATGGYRWIEPATLSVVALTNHFITTNKVAWPGQSAFRREKGTATERLPSFTLHDSEVYLNHSLVGPRTVLLGFQYRDAEGGEWMQERAGWFKPAGRGWLFYFQPGHSVRDFEEATFRRLVINAIVYDPR